MIRLLVMDDKAKAEIVRVRAHAEANHYRLGQPTPGDNPRFVARLGTYRAVFTITHLDDMVLRHLSVSVPGRKYPSPAAAFMIADAFGFTGWDQNAPSEPSKDWVCGTHLRERCVVVAQPIASDVARERVN